MEGKSYLKLLEDTKIFYKKLKRVKCINLNNELVTFGTSGFKHLLTKERKERTINEQFRKLSLLKYVIEVINSENPEVGIRRIDSKDYGIIEYTSLTNSVDGRKVRVILRRLGSGHYHFWSIMDI